MEPKYWWTIIGIVGFIVEIFTPGFFAASIGIGAFFGAATAMFTDTVEYQMIAMAIGSLISFVAIRPLWMKYLMKAKDVKSNADALIGRVGVVSEDIVPEENSGRVAIDGDDWRAVSEDGTKIDAGSQVKVLSRESIVLTVKLI
ncbi:MAG: NfeD family protein [Schleiferiaceae bacterium]|jgi:membrane protein implicated in regulation of membrane protease activity|nr:NfeD family protein [Schleiferiaceae bacterium]